MFLLLIVLCISWGLTGWLRRYALSKSLMDVPNARSSHSIPTPRGGGVSIVVTFLIVLAFSNLWLFFIAGFFVALIGWVDDHGHIKSSIRLLVHMVSSVIIVYSIDGLPTFNVFDFEADLGIYGSILAVLALVWILNLYNFMDGIDGIAGIEAITSTVSAGLILWFVFERYAQAELHFYLATASLGFLLWNWPPAKIFMGDAGSGFLGLMLGALMLYSMTYEKEMLWIWLILLAVFIVDATYTLFRRLFRGDKVYEAHRSHAYQFASRKYANHKSVTLSVLFINLFWLSPWAVFVAIDLVDGLLGLIFAYMPIIWLAWYFKAGKLESFNK